MKKALFSLLFAMVVFSCAQQEELVVDEPDLFDISSLSFNFTVNSPGDTKAVKTGWETGDKVFVFFSGLSTGYVTFEYGTSSWNVPVVSGTGSIAPEGTLTAVYLPFCNDDDIPSHGASGWAFSQPYYSYYLVSQNTTYTIDSELSTLSAKMVMENPEGYVQFFVTDENAVNGAYTLQSDAVTPVALASVGDDGIVTESKKNSSSAMPGYAYQGGYLFSGKLVPDSQYISSDGINGISFVGRYYFVKTKVSDSSREDYCTDAVTLTSHFAAKLPANGSPKWIPVGPDKYVDLGGDVKWATCNLTCDRPEEIKVLFAYNTLTKTPIGAPAIDLNGVTIPESSHGQWLIDNCTKGAYIVCGQVGLVFKSTTTGGFIFLPCLHRNWGGDYVFGYDPSIDKWYPMLFDCRPTLSVSLASTIGISNFADTGTTIRSVKYKDNVPNFSSPFSSEVEI